MPSATWVAQPDIARLERSREQTLNVLDTRPHVPFLRYIFSYSPALRSTSCRIATIFPLEASNMAARSIERYSSDTPIQSPREDLLNRNNFAKQIARDIHAWKGRESLVIALYGGWGSGKTSLKNLIVSNLQ